MREHQVLIHIHPEAPAKPAWGAPCNGCGVCCLVEPCPLGMVLSRKRRGRCAALQWAGKTDEAGGGRYVCGMLAAPLAVLGWRGRLARALAPGIARLARRWISAGRGCDASIEIAPPSAP